MIRLRLKQFALACGATAKWVRNARPRLGQPIEYTDDDARWLRLARALNRDVGIPLCAAGELARRVLEHNPNTATRMPGTPMAGTADCGTRDLGTPSRASDATRSPRVGCGRPGRVTMVTVDSEGIRLTIDLHRFDSTFAAALSGALAFGENRRAGRKRRAPAHAGAALGPAWRLAIDRGPLRSRARYAAMAEIAPRSRAGRCGSSRDSVRRSESVLLLASISPDRLERRQVNLSSEIQLPEERRAWPSSGRSSRPKSDSFSWARWPR
jgi:hypothetical protein